MKVAGMCCVIRIGALSVTASSRDTSRVSACGPPVEAPISSTRGGIGGERPQLELAGSGSPAGGPPFDGALHAAAEPAQRRIDGAARIGRRQRTLAAADAERADFLDQLALERRRGHHPAFGGGLRDVIGGAERQRLERHLGVVAGQRRGHDDGEIAAALQQLRQGRDAVELGHLDVEHDDVGPGVIEPLDRLAAVAQRGDELEPRRLVDPARQQAAHDGGVVDHHDADFIRRRNDRRAGQRLGQ